MTDTTLPIRDGALMPRDRKVLSEAGVITPYNAEHPDQRLALLAALAATKNVLPLIKPWAAWTPSAANDMRNYAGVEIQVTGAGTATFTRSADDATYAAISATASGVAAASPLALGFYNLKGGGYLKFAGTATILIRGYN
jgi:hypothetical protein